MNDADDSQGGDTAAEAFEAMRGELALLRRAVEGLAAERGAIEIPDYTETLGRMQRGVDATADRIAVINDVIARSPALAMTPEQMAQRIAAAGNAARREDQRTLAETRAGLDQAARQLTGLVASARRGDEQNRWLAGVGVAGALVGAALWVALAGPIARAMPESWQWPERMAARTLDRSQWDAGQRLMASAASASWAGIVAGDRIITANRAAIERCRKAAKVGKPTRCRIEVPTAGS